jgi:hypothetical protein
MSDVLAAMGAAAARLRGAVAPPQRADAVAAAPPDYTGADVPAADPLPQVVVAVGVLPASATTTARAQAAATAAVVASGDASVFTATFRAVPPPPPCPPPVLNNEPLPRVKPCVAPRQV